MIPEKKKYKNNFLTQVICQLTFVKNDAISDESLKDYKKLLGDDYSELATIKQQGIFIESDGSQIKSHAEDTNLWQIESTDKSHAIVVTPTSFAIVYTKYVKFRDYIDIVTSAQKLFIEHFDSIDQINRLGLRYVNQITPKSLDHGWSQYIEAEFVPSLSFVDTPKMLRSMHSMVIQHDDDIRVNFNYGIYNEFFPAPVTKNEFILDLDAYTDDPMDFEDCADLIERFNTVIAIYFERSITDTLREEMEVIQYGEQE